jgi:hypothetical protein
MVHGETGRPDVGRSDSPSEEPYRKRLPVHVIGVTGGSRIADLSAITDDSTSPKRMFQS